MSNLRFINETKSTSVSSFQVNDIFTDDYDVYKIVISDIDGASTDNWSHMRFVGEQGNLIQTSSYSFAGHQFRSYAGVSENKNTSQSEFQYLFYDAATTPGACAVIYVFNPTNTSYFTSIIAESNGFNGTSGTDGHKYIGIYRVENKITGFGFRRASGTYDSITARTYGMRSD